MSKRRAIEFSALFGIGTALFVFFQANDAFEKFVDWSAQYEQYEMDEWILAIPIMTLVLCYALARSLLSLRKKNQKLAASDKALSSANTKLISQVALQTANLIRTNRSQEVLIKGIQRIAHATDEIKLLESLCDLLVNEGTYKMAWVGYASHDKEKTVRKMAHCGFENQYIEKAKIVWANTERGQGPVGRSIRNKETIICRDIKNDSNLALWKTDALERGYESLISLPLVTDNCCFGALTMYSDRTNAFDRKEQALLQELAKTLSYGIDHLNTQKKLSWSENKFRSLFEHSNDGIILHDLDGLIIDANQKAEEMTGYPRNELVGKQVATLHPDSEVQTCLNAFETTRERGYAGFESKFLTRAGAIIDVSINSKIYNKKENLVQGIIRDISGSKRLQEQLNQALKMESIGKLAGGIAHEFNNILSIIIGNNELLMEDLPEHWEARASAEEIHSAGMRARDVVKQLLTFSRQDNAVKTVTDFNAVVSESLKLIRSSTPANIEIRQHLSDQSTPVLCNATQINQVLINLSNNAIDALPSKNGWIRIELSNEILVNGQKNYPALLKPGPYVKLVFSDNGIGMNTETLKRVFEPYFTTKEIGKGSGIGLAVVHGIVEKHGASIIADSLPGNGTTFTMLFPAHATSAVTHTPTDDAVSTGKESILFVDDEPALVKMGSRLLESLGYTVESTTSPLKALEMMRHQKERFDLVISDMTMPEMTGDRLITAILDLRPDLPTIICTGYSTLISTRKAREIGVHALIMKPLNKKELADAVRKALDHGTVQAEMTVPGLQHQPL